MQQSDVNEVWKVSFSHDGQTLASSGKERTVRFWEVPDRGRNAIVNTFDEHRDFMYFNGGIRKLASQEEGDVVQFWQVLDGRL